MARINCPSCGSDIIRRSRRRNIWEHLIGIFGVKPYFCDDCAFRFFSRALKKQKTLETNSSIPSRDRRKRFAPWWILFGLLVLATGAAWWVFSPGEEGNIQTPESPAKAGKKISKDIPATQATPSTVPSRGIITTSTTSPTTASTASTVPTTTSTITTTTMAITPKSPAAAPGKLAIVKPQKVGGASNNKKKKCSPAATKAKSYSVQFGAFKSPGRAGNLVKGLKKKGVKARVDKISDRKRTILYKVRVGSYKKRSDALAAIKSLRRKTGLECFVARAH